MTTGAILTSPHWDVQYQSAHLPWETNRPSPELQRVFAETRLRPCRAVELGCGSGVNAVWLARQGFDVTAIDLSPTAIRRARQRALAAGVSVRFIAGNLLATELGGPFGFVLDRGCYHAVRLAAPGGYLRALARITRPGSVGLFLTGNAAEPEDDVGPPVMEAWQLRTELGQVFDDLTLRPFRWDAPPGAKRYLGWSCFGRRY